LNKRKLSIAIPASVVSDTPHLRERTAKIGLIGRAAAIFKVNEIIVYPDVPKHKQTADADLVAMLLTYMETPQYLRKRLFKIMPELQFAGVLPPLRTSHHPLNSRKDRLTVGEYREGVALAKTDGSAQVDIGVEQPALVTGMDLSVGKRVTVRIVEVGKQIKAELAASGELPSYWGYTVVSEQRPLGKLVANRHFDLTVATSKYGVSFAEAAEQIGDRWRGASSILVVFGPPTAGLHEIAKREGLSLDRIVDFVVNTIPGQGTETVRTEEALLATLAVLNVRFGL